MVADEQRVFSFEEIDDRRVVIRFGRFCDETRLPEDERRLAALVARYEAVAVDLSSTELMISDWLRGLQHITLMADQVGKTVALAGAREGVLGTADAIALKDRLRFVDTVEDVWNL